MRSLADLGGTILSKTSVKTVSILVIASSVSPYSFCAILNTGIASVFPPDNNWLALFSFIDRRNLLSSVLISALDVSSTPPAPV